MDRLSDYRHLPQFSFFPFHLARFDVYLDREYLDKETRDKIEPTRFLPARLAKPTCLAAITLLL